MNLFLVPTISFRLLYGLLILQHGRRELLWVGVTAHPTAGWIARQLTEAYGWQRAPRYIIRDRDRVYGHAFSVGCKRWAFGIGRFQCGRHGRTDVLNGSLGPSGGIALTMSLCLASGTFVICSTHYQKYYNEARTHLSLEKDAPIPRAVQAIGQTLAVLVLGGLHHQYVRT
jgi:hypothetical protein